MRGQVIHAIGPGGHSNRAVEELFSRAGGLACVNAILASGTNLSHGGFRSMKVGRTPGCAIPVLASYGAANHPIAHGPAKAVPETPSSRQPAHGLPPPAYPEPSFQRPVGRFNDLNGILYPYLSAVNAKVVVFRFAKHLVRIILQIGRPAFIDGI